MRENQRFSSILATLGGVGVMVCVGLGMVVGSKVVVSESKGGRLVGSKLTMVSEK